jgi:cell wall-associated NlpC family hydrolase
MIKFNKVFAGCSLAFSLMLISSVGNAAAIPAKITGTNVKVRKAATTSAGIVTKLSNSRVSVLDKSNGWYKISFNNKTGWVNDDYLKLTSISGKINANGVNFRKSPSTKGKLIKSLNKNTSITILDSSNGWNRVKAGSQIGYVASRFVNSNTSARNTTSSKTSRSNDNINLSQSESSFSSRVISYAKKFVGVRYVYGGASPNTGFDCTGFIEYVYKNFGVKLSRTAESMYLDGTKVSKYNLKAGDLLFFDASSRKESGVVDHAGIYLGGDTFIHASSSNGEVRLQKLSQYGGTFLGAKRVI